MRRVVMSVADFFTCFVSSSAMRLAGMVRPFSLKESFIIGVSLRLPRCKQSAEVEAQLLVARRVVLRDQGAFHLLALRLAPARQRA